MQLIGVYKVQLMGREDIQGIKSEEWWCIQTRANQLELQKNKDISYMRLPLEALVFTVTYLKTALSMMSHPPNRPASWTH